MPSSQQVPAQWPPKLPTRIAFVAEAPSWEELEKGQPLVGPSGRIFNALLRTAGLDRSEYLVTNVFNEKLPDNDVHSWCASLKEAKANGFTDLPPIGTNGFLRPEYRHHLDRLRKELCLAKPNVVVPLGGTALWAFTGGTSITAVRGTVGLSTHIVPGLKLLPTYHPAAIMHQWKLYPVVVADLMKAEREAKKGPDIAYVRRELLLEPTLDDLRASVPKLLASDLVSVDIETGWGQLTCIGFAWDAEHAICIPFLDKRTASKSYWSSVADEMEAWRIVQQILAAPMPKLFQNGAGYDLYWLLKKYHLRVTNAREDTRLMHHAIYPELPKSLLFMGSSYANQGAWKHWGKQQDKRDDS